MCNDGTTINDRLFQSLDTVQHDYQLGSQYASTRALVEIPLFEEFFFDNPDKGIFPGPDNSMKLHIDATHTAHSWNPNPVVEEQMLSLLKTLRFLVRFLTLSKEVRTVVVPR
jgi:hypothetical protein